jgi:hypothetical protein
MAACSFFLICFLVAAHLVAGYGAITGVVGDAGGSGAALGIIASTPRDGTRRNPFQQDTTRFKDDAANTFGETLAADDNGPGTGTQAVLAANGGTLPQITAGGEAQMTTAA